MTTQNHNPDNLTDWGQSEGWRLLTAVEMKKPLPKDAEYFDGVEAKWSESTYRGEVPRRTDQINTTYRTREPLPSQPSDDLNYYEHYLPKIIAGVRRGEKWEFFNAGVAWCPGYSIDQFQQLLKEGFRVRLAPVPVVKWWDCMLDIPTPCWLASTSDARRAYLVVEVSPDGVWTSNGGGHQWWTWQRLRKPDIRHSTDLCHWSPCVKPEGGK